MGKKWVFPETPEELAGLEHQLRTGAIRVLDHTESSTYARKGGWLILEQASRQAAPPTGRFGWPALRRWFGTTS